MKYILILLISVGYNGGVTTIEFATKEQCEQAWIEIKENFPIRRGGLSHYCLPVTKGTYNEIPK